MATRDDVYHGRRWRTSSTMQLRAHQLRRVQTPAEAKLWEALRDRQFENYKFRRQHPLDRFIVDFYCPKLGFIIEVDGAVHWNRDQACRDEERTAMLQSMGYRVYRLTNKEVETNLPGVLDALHQTLAAMALASARSSPLPLKRERGQGGGLSPPFSLAFLYATFPKPRWERRGREGKNSLL